MLNTDLDKEGIKEFFAIWGTLEEYEKNYKKRNHGTNQTKPN